MAEKRTRRNAKQWQALIDQQTQSNLTIRKRIRGYACSKLPHIEKKFTKETGELRFPTDATSCILINDIIDCFHQRSPEFKGTPTAIDTNGIRGCAIVSRKIKCWGLNQKSPIHLDDMPAYVYPLS